MARGFYAAGFRNRNLYTRAMLLSKFENGVFDTALEPGFQYTITILLCVITFQQRWRVLEMTVGDKDKKGYIHALDDSQIGTEGISLGHAR